MNRRSVLFMGMLFTSLLGANAFAHGNHHHGHEGGAKEISEDQTAIFHQINDSYLKSVKPVFQKKCFDCHSNQTVFPWYHSLPLVAWYLDSDVKEGREHLDFTPDFPFQGHGSPQDDLEAIASEIRKKEMPPFLYKLMHPASSLDADEANAVLKWTKESLALMSPASGNKKEEPHDE